MTELILTFIFAVLSIIGLTEIIDYLKSVIMGSKNKPFCELWIYLEADTPDLQLESYLRSINTSKISKIYAVLSGMECLAECEKIAEKYNAIIIKK